MRRLRMVFVVAAVASLLAAAPVSARPDGSLPGSWAAFGEGVVDWVAGVWRIVAGSETPLPAAEPTSPDSPDTTLLDGSGETSFGTTSAEGEKTPAVDPDG